MVLKTSFLPPINLQTKVLCGYNTGRIFLQRIFSNEVELIYNVVLVSGVQQSDSDIYIYFFQILFPYRFLQNIEYSSLCYTIGLCWLPTLYIVPMLFVAIVKVVFYFVYIFNWLLLVYKEASDFCRSVFSKSPYQFSSIPLLANSPFNHFPMILPCLASCLTAWSSMAGVTSNHS